MMRPVCSSDTAEICGVDERRPLVRSSATLAGIDYVEVLPDGVTLRVHFFGAMPKNLTTGHIVIEGGERIRGIKVVSAHVREHENGDLCLQIQVDKTGDFSPYCACLVEPDTNSNSGVEVLER